MQEVKRKIKEIPSVKDAIVRGDGQVVVVDFSEEGYSIEVCPGFERTDGAFDYPDSNDGGKWKKTDPNPEIDESIAMFKETNEHFKYLAQLLRSWKNNEGFKFCGLLIDTLVYNFLEENPSHKSTSFNLYLPLMKDLYLYLKNQKEEQKYWYALGSNQHVYNKKGKFIKKAKVVYEKIKDLTETSENVYEVFQEVFGLSFPMEESFAKSFVVETASYSRTEQYIESTYPVDIKFTLRIDCKVEQNGFLVDTLRNVLRKGFKLPRSRSLIFKIEENELKDWLDKSDFPRNYKVYWKVLNRGEEAMRRDMVRGQILKDDGKEQRKEHTDFNGEHLVECYIIYRGVCVARDRIHVPIMI
ncbi:nucleotide-binding domain-containing protein [Paenibacillus sp.]|uniref:nucleotide-binding domain-containing protein n=1 Tax=Paenibacillus sp. TaxID=58172 RepID=UPI0028AFCAE7|nr:nucleotidyltransferase [Paenibacillus sp.]